MLNSMIWLNEIPRPQNKHKKKSSLLIFANMNNNKNSIL